MERPKRKAINFDLDTKEMKGRSMYPNGYELLRVSFKERGFDHRQGSGYLSQDKITTDDVVKVVTEIVHEQPWLADCVKKIDVTDIGRQHDLTAIVKAAAEERAEQVDQAKPARLTEQAEQSEESKFSSREDQINSLMSVCKRQLSNEIASDHAQEQRQAEQARQAEQVGQVRQAGAKSSGSKGKGKAPRGKW